ncbi:hypothetical protein CH370_02280 [Leptospira kmetyi]|nr:hypothetical protein CH370_02280 [Leptospira kmetyi]
MNSGSSLTSNGLTESDPSVGSQEIEIQSSESTSYSKENLGNPEWIILNPYLSIRKDNRD